MNAMSERRWRWTFARWLNRFPSVCWANAVSWVLGDSLLSEIKQDRFCAADLAANGSCYCGKLNALSSTPGCSPGRGESGEGVRGSAASLDAPLTTNSEKEGDR